MGSLISVVVSDMCMEDLEDEAMDEIPQDTRPSMCRCYIDGSFEVVKWDKRDELSEHLNSIDTTGSIKFTDKQKTGGVSHFWMR